MTLFYSGFFNHACFPEKDFSLLPAFLSNASCNLHPKQSFIVSVTGIRSMLEQACLSDVSKARPLILFMQKEVKKNTTKKQDPSIMFRLTNVRLAQSAAEMSQMGKREKGFESLLFSNTAFEV